jgi:hypothetical protein
MNMNGAKTAQIAFLCCLLLAMLHVQHLCYVDSILFLSTEQQQPQVPKWIDSPNASDPSNIKLPRFLLPYSRILETSDFVELDHCSLSTLNWTNFTSWAAPILDQAITKGLQSAAEALKNESIVAIRDEWTMELLEMYATNSGLCHFDQYRQRVGSTAATVEAGQQLQRVVKKVPTPRNHARIAFTIVAYQDVAHLRRLVEAIHMRHHLIVIHVEEPTETKFVEQVSNLASSYQNVVVLKFGTVVYKSDSVSRINLQLMDWLVHDLELEYDYHVTLGGAVYPLYGASEFAQYLHSSSGHVWLGELTHKGNRVHHPQWGVLWKKRLVTTSYKVTAKAGFLFAPNVIPNWMDAALQHKSVSGNQAVFSRSTVQAMLQSPKVQHLFALAKYGCCCCVEERTWIAAMDLLGLLDEAKNKRSMYQLWGGDTDRCVGSMHNAVLDMDETRCFRFEHPDQDDTLYVWGNSTWNYLVRAKQEGVLFARKFRSDHNGSTELLHRIRTTLHETGPSMYSF